MKNFLASIALICMFMACNTAGDKQTGADTITTIEHSDTAETFTPVDTSTEFIQTFSSNLEPWLQRTTKVTTLRLDNFSYVDNWVEDSLVISKANLTPEFYKTYKPLLIFSPDSTRVLDMGSYGAMVSKNSSGQTTMVQGEPDSEIAVVDRATNKKRRIFFFGPGTAVEKGFWMNDSTIVLAGKSEDSSAAVKPVIWTVRLEGNSNFYKRYEPRQ